MITLRLFASCTLSVHPTTAWYLADLGEFRGMQTLETWQSAQRLKALREHALIESAVSSNRIEGVSVEPARVREVLVAASPLFRDRDEEEVYRATPLRGVARILGALRPGSDGDAAQKRRQTRDTGERCHKVSLATPLRGVAHILALCAPGPDGDAAQSADRCVTPQSGVTRSAEGGLPSRRRIRCVSGWICRCGIPRNTADRCSDAGYLGTPLRGVADILGALRPGA